MAGLNGKAKQMPDLDKPTVRKPDDRKDVVARTGGGEEIVSTQAVLNAKGPFGAIDTVAPGARLQMLIDSAQNFRATYPQAPKRQLEVAIDEVVRLRAVERAKNGELETLRRLTQVALEKAASNALLANRLVNESAEQNGIIYSLRSDREWLENSRWFRLGQRLGFYK